MAALEQQRFFFGFGERTPETALAIVDFAPQVFGEFVDDVGALRSRQIRSDGLDVAIDEFHSDYSPETAMGRCADSSRILSSESFRRRHSSVKRSRVSAPPGDRR